VTPPLFLVDPLPDGSRIALVGEEGRHAARVRRLQAGEDVLVGDGRGSVLSCVVAAVLPSGLELEVLAARREPPPAVRLVVVQALAKGERAELAVEIMTELGVDEIVPWAAARSVVQWHGERGARALERWRRVVREAVKQSRRAWLPEIAPPASTAEVAARLASGRGLLLHEAASESLAVCAVPDAGELLLVVGPEGGIAPDEIDVLTAAGAPAVRMGRPVLRTSTAGAAALAALSVRLGRWA
jgi:16S rRNA (uracil1498-N3)-methyltransferase